MSISSVSRLSSTNLFSPDRDRGLNVYQARSWSALKDDLFPVDPEGFPTLASHVSVALHLFLRGYVSSDIAAALSFLRIHGSLTGCPTFIFDRRDEADSNRILARHRERVVETLDAGFDVTV